MMNSRSLDAALRSAIEADAGLTQRTVEQAHAAYLQARGVPGAQWVELDAAWQQLMFKRQQAARDVATSNEHSARWWSSTVAELRAALAALETFKAAEVVPMSAADREAMRLVPVVVTARRLMGVFS